MYSPKNASNCSKVANFCPVCNILIHRICRHAGEIETHNLWILPVHITCTHCVQGSPVRSHFLWDISTKFGLLIDLDLLNGSDINRYETGSSIQPSRPPSWEMDMTSYFRSGCFDLDKVRYSLMKNNVQISGKWSKSKPKVDFQYGGRLFCKNGSSYILAINWDMSTTFGLLIDFDLLKAATSTNAKPEIVLNGRHLDKRYDVIFLQ